MFCNLAGTMIGVAVNEFLSRQRRAAEFKMPLSSAVTCRTLFQRCIIYVHVAGTIVGRARAYENADINIQDQLRAAATTTPSVSAIARAAQISDEDVCGRSVRLMYQLLFADEP